MLRRDAIFTARERAVMVLHSIGMRDHEIAEAVGVRHAASVRRIRQRARRRLRPILHLLDAQGHDVERLMLALG